MATDPGEGVVQAGGIIQKSVRPITRRRLRIDHWNTFIYLQAEI